MCAIVGFTYTPFLYIHYPELVIYPGLLSVFSVIILLLNSKGWHSITRPINCFQMITLATLFHASIIRENDPVLLSFFCTQLAMTLIPWAIYSTKELGALVGTLVACYGLLAAQPWLNSQIEVSVDVAFFRESYLNPMTYVSAVIIQLCSLGFILIEKAGSPAVSLPVGEDNEVYATVG